MKNPPLTAVPEQWAWPASYRGRRHRLSRVVTGPDGERGDDVLGEWWRGEIYGVAVCGYDGRMFGGETDLEDLPRCARCEAITGVDKAPQVSPVHP